MSPRTVAPDATQPAPRQLETSVGVIEYRDTGGAGPVVVLLHGMLMDATLWDDVVAQLPGVRCIVPVLPLGAHRIAVDPQADLSLPGIAGLVDEIIDRLELTDVTLVGNDTGGALTQLVAVSTPSTRPAGRRVGRIVLASCEAFENFPPGLTGKTLAMTRRLSPGLWGAFMQQLRMKPMRRLPITFGWLTKRGDRTARGWLQPVLHDKAIRRDAVRMLRAAVTDKQLFVRTAQQLTGYDRPALVLWATGDRVMPIEHGRRLAQLLPQGKLVEVDDSYTLIPLDQPAAFAAALRDFIGS